MRTLKYGLLVVAAGALFAVSAPRAQAQVSFGINIGGAPSCPYGYYGYAPYNCAPYGYYGPEWFNNGVFIGAGRWFHGDPHFRGHVNRDFDPRYGYHGSFPDHGGFREPDDHWHGFHASHDADPHGHYHGRAHDDHHDDHHGH